MAFIFYDTETTGTDTSFDQILQFAAIKTDDNLNALDSFNIRCRLLPHVVPSPTALLVTGVNVADLTAAPLSHFEMMRRVRAKMNEWCGDGAIFAGWNSPRFDESMLRQAYYQTLLPVYQTNSNGNGRADLMRMVQVTSACLPNCLNVPLDANGKLTFRLGLIAEANDVRLDHAHEALADTGATLGVARLLKQRAPAIWDTLIEAHKFMRYEKAEIVHRIALDMQGSAEGLALEEIRTRYSDKPLSRRTAERLRDTVERLFPIEHANPGEVPKRWRLRGATPGAMASVTAAELADLATAASVLRRENMLAQARNIEKVAAKLRAHLKGPMVSRVEPDLEALTEAEGLATRPGPRPKLDSQIISTLRHAILSTRKVRIHYRYRGSGKHGFDFVHPYGFLYGSRHYLVAWSENPQAQDFRNFALANIERVELLDQPFSRNNQFSLAAYAARSFGVFQEEPYRVVWKFDKEAAEQAKEFLFHPTQELQPQPDGSLVVRFTAGGALEMAWHLYIWGNHVKVIEPKSFWSHVRKMREVSLP